MALNYGNLNLRKSIIEEIKSYNNQVQKKDSLKQFEIFRGRIYPYVLEYLQSLLSENSVREMPVISALNILKRVIKQSATLYQEAPTRTFVNLSDDQIKVLTQVYEDMQIDQKMAKANEYYKIQDQTHLQVLLENQKLHLRCLMRHHIDVVPDEMNSEFADAYIVTGFDRSMYSPRLSESEDAMNQLIADPEDYKEQAKKYALWSNDYNFVMNEQGGIISGPDVVNPIGLMPFVDICNYKDFEYFNRLDMSVTDFTVQLNGAMSDLGQIVRMQGFAQAYLKGPEDLLPPQNIVIGPTYVLKLPIDKNNPTETEFGFASPNSDLAGSINYIETLISTFLSSVGIDPKTISGKAESKSYSSGIERLLANLERFEATRADQEAFINGEKKLFKIICRYLNTYAGSDALKYKIAAIDEENADIEINFKKPEMIQTEEEKLNSIRNKLELQLITQVEAIAMDRNISEEAAEAIYEEMQQEYKMHEQEESKQEETKEVELEGENGVESDIETMDEQDAQGARS